MYTLEELNEKAHELRRLKAEADKIGEQIKELQEQFKSEMTAQGKYELTGDDWKITWNSISSNRFDQKGFQSENPVLYEQYMKITESRRFILS